MLNLQLDQGASHYTGDMTENVELAKQGGLR